MRSSLVALVFAARRRFARRVAGAEEARRRSRHDGWIDLMKPDVWKKVDAKWIVTDEVKLDPDEGTTRAEGREEGRRQGLGERREPAGCRTSSRRRRSATARSTSSS